ncbi:MAG: PilZ domain-containing protein [Treponema sp.]|nr:PilZ domain-containing protein [Treponema sp.]
MTAFVAILISLGFGYLVFSQVYKGKKMNWVQFFAKGREAGFSFKETDVLRNIASQCAIEDINLIFSNQNQLDICIRAIVRSLKTSTASEDITHDFLSKLYDFRKKIEMNRPEIKNGLSNSRQIVEGQILKILVPQGGVYRSQIIKNTYQYITIARPVNDKKKYSSFSWNNSKISVYFWREDDAGYVFDSLVLDEVFSLGFSSLKIAHSESLLRTQKRSSIRMKLHKAAFLYLAHESEPPHEIESDPGLRCYVEDISDTGCAVMVAGRAEGGLRVKIQFALDNGIVCMTGMVRSTSFNEETGQSIMRIEAENLPLETRNIILGEIFGMSPDDDDDDDLPFTVLDNEAASIAGNTGFANREIPGNPFVENENNDFVINADDSARLWPGE